MSVDISGCTSVPVSTPVQMPLHPHATVPTPAPTQAPAHMSAHVRAVIRAHAVAPTVLAQVSIAEVIGSSLSLFSYDAPAVTFVNRYNAPPSGMASMTLNGVNFGLGAADSRSMRVGVTPCATYSWQSDTSVQCASTVGYGNTVA